MGPQPYVERYVVQGGVFDAIGEASTQLKSVLKMLGVPSDITRRATVVAYEAEMYLVIHAGGGEITASVFPDRLELFVRDEGPGIPEEARQGVLERGARLDEQVAGHGLGLGIVRDIVEAWSGRMALQQSPQGGLRVHIELPRRAGR